MPRQSYPVESGHDYIAMNYLDAAARMNSEARNDFLKRLLPLGDEISKLECYVNLLPMQEQCIIRRCYFEGARQEAVAEELDVTAWTVRRYRDVSLHITYGNHEQLYDLLRLGKIDIAMNDQRRAFSSEHENLTLADLPCQVEVAAREAVAQLPL